MTIPIFGLALAESVLSIDGSFLFIFFSILLLIYILNHTLFKPINRVLEERERLGAGRIGEARQMLGEYEERLKRYESRLREARGDAYQRLEAGRREAMLERQRLVAEVKAETTARIDAAKREIAEQAGGAKQNLEKEVRAMAATISSRILRRSVSAGGD
ncbi:MAG TPA: ATP synthase F0 subunit B [Blastocatellia bacterium]|nr:ATP synthase F0 subunit B [Blastocatellia bacterium]